MAEENSIILSTNVDAHKLITDEHVKGALCNDKGPNAQLKSFEVIDFAAKGDNYACFVTSVKVNYILGDKHTNVTYIVKLNPCRRSEAMEEFTVKIFNKEANFYTKLLPDLDNILTSMELPSLKLPRCYYTCNNPKQEILFLEDMRKKGFKMFDRMKGLDDQHAVLVIEELSRLHSASVILQENLGLEEFEKKYDFLDELFGAIVNENDFFKEWFKSIILVGASIAKKLKDYEFVADFLTGMANNAHEIMLDEVQAKAPFKVICHGDCWNNNLLFRYDGEGKPVEICLVDLQINRYASNSLDLNYLLFTSVNGDVRKHGLTKFLTTYYSTWESVFSASKKAMQFSQDELYQEYRNHNMFGLLMSVMILPLILTQPSDVPDYTGMTEEELLKSIAEHEANTMALLETSTVLRPRVLDMFDEMIENGIIKK